MSAVSKGTSGGQPSTTQPSAGPWLSPKVVTRKRWPNVLWDMGGSAGNARVLRAKGVTGQTVQPASDPAGLALVEDDDAALPDLGIRSLCAREAADEVHQHAGHAAVGHHDALLGKRVQPGPHAFCQAGIALALGRNEAPLVALA